MVLIEHGVFEGDWFSGEDESLVVDIELVVDTELLLHYNYQSAQATFMITGISSQSNGVVVISVERCG